MALFADRTRMMGTENAFKMGQHINRAEASGQPVIRLNLGEPDFNAPDWVVEAVVAQLRAGNTRYCDWSRRKGLPLTRTSCGS